jgi:hypothetical protein
MNMSRLEKRNYDSDLIRRLKKTKYIPLEGLNVSTANILDPSGSYRVVYQDPREYRRLAARFKLMSDIRVRHEGSQLLHLSLHKLL